MLGEESIRKEIYRVAKTLISRPRDQLLIPEESCLSALEEYCRNEIGAHTMVTLFRDYHHAHRVSPSQAGCLIELGLLGASIYGFTQSVWFGLAGLAVTSGTTLVSLRAAGRYEMASNQPPHVWERAVEQAKPKLEELLRKQLNS